MPDYQAAAERRMQGKSSRKPAQTQNKPDAVNMGSIQKLIDATQGTPDTGQQGIPQAPQQMMPGQLGQNIQQESGPYSGPGAPELHEALNKAKSGVDEPGPPQAVMRRMKAQQIQQSLQPDVADLAARYGVIPRGPV